MSEIIGSEGPTSGSFRQKIDLFFRLTRIQFIPLVILPALAGTAYAYSITQSIDLAYLAAVLLGVILLHLGANAIDDCYDFQNGVDQVANSFFPKAFPAWKPIARGRISLKKAKIVSFALFTSSLIVGIYFWIIIGLWAFVLPFFGFLIAFYYCAPPLKLDYRGLGLGEIGIFFAFGPIPVLGAYYVQTGILSFEAFLVSLPIGIMTVTILMNHDLMFYEVYSTAKKFSLGTVLGRKKSLRVSLFLTLSSYLMVATLYFAALLPIWSLLAPLFSGLILLRKREVFSKPNEKPPFYASFTLHSLISNWVFSFLIALSLLIK
ncbi:MAG: UbiA family prenyltransferase [Nitrososphaerales archaeon]